MGRFAPSPIGRTLPTGSSLASKKETTIATEVPKPTSLGGQALLSFEGCGSEALRIATINAVLQILTLGFYRFWARTQFRRFLWRETNLLGEPLEYTGRGLHLVLSTASAVALVGVLSIAISIFTQTHRVLGELLVLVNAVLIYALLEIGIYKARGYRLSHTAWRGIRFGQTGSGVRYALNALGWTLMVGITVGIIKPWMDTELFRLRWANTWFGNHRFEILDNGRTPCRWWLAIYVPPLVIAMLAAIFEPDDDAATAGTALWGLVVYVVAGCVAYGFFRVEQLRYFAGCIRLGNARISSNLRAQNLFPPALVCALVAAPLLIVVVTVLGLLWVWYTSLVEIGMETTFVLAAFVAIAGWSLHGIFYDGYIVPWVIKQVAATFAFHGDPGIVAIIQSDRRIPGAGEGLASTLDIGESV